MFVHRRKLYAAVQAVLDALSFWPIWLFATYLRIALDPFTQRQLTEDQSHRWVAPIGLIFLLCFAVSLRLGLYVVPHRITLWTILTWASENTIALCAVTVLTVFFSRQFGAGASRIFVLCMAPSALVVLTVTRCLALAIIAAMQRRGSPPRIALIGDLITAKHLISRMESQISSTVRGLIVPEGTALSTVPELLPVLGTTGQIAELVNRERIDRVIMINNSLPDAELERCNKVFWRMGLPVSCALDLPVESNRPESVWRHKGQLELSREYGLRTVALRSEKALRGQEIAKRTLDLVLAGILFFLCLPLMVCLAILVKLTSAGLALEKAPRVGKGGRHFTCLKFRTTYEDLSGPVQTARRFVGTAQPPKDEPAVTPLGSFLRRYSLDELPQLLNILRGEMSLVGPRPLPAHELDPDGMSQQFYAWSEARARVHPGLTGLWQVSGRSSLSFEDMIRLDLEYIETRSLSLDLAIMLETPVPVLRGVGAS